MAWINPADGKRTEQQCQGAQQVPVVAGSLPADTDGCFWQGVQNLFGVGDSSAPAAPSSSSTPIRN
jgi:penicillin-binding protein 1B